MSPIPDYESKPVPVVKTRENPFMTLEAMDEHLGALRGALLKAGVDLNDKRPGHPAYHLEAIEEKRNRLFNNLAGMLPDNYRWGG